MPRNTEFRDYVVYDLLGDIPDIASRPMFSGFGLYKDGEIFAIISGDELYLKGREGAKEFFKERGSEIFSYPKKGGIIQTINYWLVPGDVLENRDELMEWIDHVI